MTAFELRAHDWFEGGAPKELAVTNTLLTIIVNDHIVSSLNIPPSAASRTRSVCLCIRWPNGWPATGGDCSMSAMRCVSLMSFRNGTI